MASKDIGQLRTRLSWEDEGANKSLEGFRRDLKGLRSEMNLAKSGGREYTNSLKGMREQSDILSRRFKTQEERVKELKKRYDESVKVKGEDANQTRDLAAQLNNANAEMNRTEGQLQRLNEEIRRMESPWTKLGENMTSAGEKFQTVGKKMSDFGKDYSMKVTAPIVAGGVAVFKASSDYESAFAGVRKTVDATEEEFATLSKGIRDMTKVLPASATEIAGVAEVAGQLGIKTEDILKFTRTMADLGVATNMSSEEAATALARLANITQMPMDQIDRLGSTVVDLGNHLATTEGEIVEMGLRLAGAGKQVGMTEAQILAFSGALSSVGVNAEAGGSAFSKVMVNMQLATEKGGKELKAFAKVAGMSASDFKKAFKDDAAGAILSFIDGLANAESQGKTAIGMLDEMGITEVRMRDSLLRAAGASDVFSDSIKLGTKAWDENIALTNEAEERYKTTESQLKIMWNRIKDVAITLGDALIPAVMDAIDAAAPLIKKIEEGAQAFSEMDKEQQETILKMFGLVAAIGPAAIALGSLTQGIGGVLKVGGGLASELGKAGGAGLLGRIGLMGAATGPVGLAVGLTGALALGIYAVAKASQESTKDILDSIQTRKEEIDSVDDLISSFEELQKKNKLSTDEVLRYMDIMTELKDAKSEEAIKALTDEQEKLREKSGLTNEQMDEFLRLNGKIVEKAPEASKAISEQGNAYAAVLDELKELNTAERQRLTDDTSFKLTAELQKQENNLAKQEKLQKDIGKLEKDRSKTIDTINNTSTKIRGQQELIRDIEDEIKTASGDQLMILEDKLHKANFELLLLVDSRKEHEKTEKSLDKQIAKKEKSLKETMKELNAFDELKDEYEQMVLYQAGLTAEKGKGVQKIHEEERAIKDARKELDKQRASGLLLTDEYNRQNQKLNEQQRKLDEAKKKLQDMNKEAGRTIYKDVNVKSNPSVDELNRRLSRPVSKVINLHDNRGPSLLSYAKGTDYHPGGHALVGEEGQELAKLGNRWSLLDFGITDLPRGTQVFTHDESKDIIRALNRMPAYASGVSSPGEANRVVNQLNSQQPMNDSSAQVVSLLRDIVKGIREGKIIQIDGETVTNIVNTNNAVASATNYF